MKNIRKMSLVCAGALAIGLGSAGCTLNTNTPSDSAGSIDFYDPEGQLACSLPIPATSQMTNFATGSSCENNLMKSFTLNNVPSATLINFHDASSCNDARTDDNFFMKLKTAKQPTDWRNLNPITYEFDALKIIEKGQLVAGRYIRMESIWVGKDYDEKNLNERLSCVYIERSQPVSSN